MLFLDVFCGRNKFAFTNKILVIALMLPVSIVFCFRNYFGRVVLLFLPECILILQCQIVVRNIQGISVDFVCSKYFGGQVGSVKIFDRLFSAAGGLPPLRIAVSSQENC
jgi:hypothetical protein